MADFHQLLDGIRQNVPEIVEDWTKVCGEEPWMHLPGDLRTDELPVLVRSVAEVALRGAFDEHVCREKLYAAARHGERRHAQGFQESVLFREFYLLRQAIWRYLMEHHHGATGEAFEAILRMDFAVSLAAKAAIRGYYRAVYERKGRWPAVIDEMVDEWTIPAPADATPPT